MLTHYHDGQKKQPKAFIKNIGKRLFTNVDRIQMQEHYDKLIADFEIVAQSCDGATSNPEIIDRIASILNREASWSHIYLLKRLMVQVYTAQQLTFELKNTLRHHNAIKNPNDPCLFMEGDFETLDDKARRAVLSQLVTNIEHIHRKKSLSKQFKRKMILRTVMLFLFSVPLFFSQYLFRIFCGSSDSINRIFNLDVHGAAACITFTALAAGYMGAAFSMLLNLRRRLEQSKVEDLKIQSSYRFMASRVFIGIGAALTFFYFLQAGIISGQMLPEISRISHKQTLVDPVSPKEWIVYTGNDKWVPQTLADSDAAAEGKIIAMLIVWCFIAGFSESFVPTLLMKTQKMVKTAPQQP